MADAYLTPREYAERLGIDVGKVIGWIHSGDLKSLDVSQTRGGRPRWRISSEAIFRFEEARSSRPADKVKRRRKRVAAVKEFF